MCIRDRYGDKHLRDVYYAQLRTRPQRSGESLQESLILSIDLLDWSIPVSYTHLDVYKRQVYIVLRQLCAYLNMCRPSYND